VSYDIKSSEIGNVTFRRSLYFVKSLRAGERVSPEAIRSVRPGYGLAPKYLDEVVGCILKADVEYGTAVSWDLLER
jgi:N-acetylneuraminate synthase